ncbi:MAG: class I SAM-dependent methyltransferase [Anaerolineales bacterium]
MQPERDPEGREVVHLLRLARFAGARVLEIGCGNGRLTWRYGSHARAILAIDPDEEALEEARDAMPADLSPRLSLSAAESEALPLPGESFDVALFAWSL